MPAKKKPVARKKKLAPKQNTQKKPYLPGTPTTCRQMLDLIDRFFVDPKSTRDSPLFREQTKLWNVLSALRGPDDQNADLKSTTTEVIRTVAFPKTGKSFNGAVVCAKFAESGKPLELPEDDGTHFANHIHAAAIALGLVVVQ